MTFFALTGLAVVSMVLFHAVQHHRRGPKFYVVTRKGERSSYDHEPLVYEDDGSG